MRQQTWILVPAQAVAYRTSQGNPRAFYSDVIAQLVPHGEQCTVVLKDEAGDLVDTFVVAGIAAVPT